MIAWLEATAHPYKHSFERMRALRLGDRAEDPQETLPMFLDL